jgi:hypothetical protein
MKYTDRSSQEAGREVWMGNAHRTVSDTASITLAIRCSSEEMLYSGTYHSGHDDTALETMKGCGVVWRLYLPLP